MFILFELSEPRETSQGTFSEEKVKPETAINRVKYIQEIHSLLDETIEFYKLVDIGSESRNMGKGFVLETFYIEPRKGNLPHDKGA